MMAETASVVSRPPNKYIGFKDKEKPTEVRTSNIIAAKGRS
jgi:hypothetical protein